MHFLSQKRHNVVHNDLVHELYELVPRDHLVMINIQLQELRVEIFLGGLNSFQVEVALDECLELLPVDLAVVLLVRAVKDLLELVDIDLSERAPVVLPDCVRDAPEIIEFLDQCRVVHLH